MKITLNERDFMKIIVNQTLVRLEKDFRFEHLADKDDERKMCFAHSKMMLVTARNYIQVFNEVFV
jgi:hypothetical protein